MRQEAQKPEYKIEGYLLRDLQQVPDGWNLSDLWPEQSTFVIYLVAMLPALTDLGTYLRYLDEKETLEEKESWTFVTERGEMQQSIDRDMAEQEGISIAEFYSREGEKVRQIQLDELERRFYPSTQANETVRALKTRLEKLKEKFGDGPVYPELPALSQEEQVEIERLAERANA